MAETAVGLNWWHRWLLTFFRTTNQSLLLICKSKSKKKKKSVKAIPVLGAMAKKAQAKFDKSHSKSMRRFVCVCVCVCVCGHWEAITLTWMFRDWNHIINSSLCLTAAMAWTALTPKYLFYYGSCTSIQHRTVHGHACTRIIVFTVIDIFL